MWNRNYRIGLKMMGYLILGTIMFGPKGKKTMDIPKERIISASLLYVRQLEQIV
jgi:hypothetical protein